MFPFRRGKWNKSLFLLVSTLYLFLLPSISSRKTVVITYNQNVRFELNVIFAYYYMLIKFNCIVHLRFLNCKLFVFKSRINNLLYITTIHCTMSGGVKYLSLREISRYVIHMENEPNEPLLEDIAAFAFDRAVTWLYHLCNSYARPQRRAWCGNKFAIITPGIATRSY